jgi:hypothetical protein
MSINKNFVVRNGFEVSTDLILANADTRRVGIASTNPQYTLDVAGGIGATDIFISGVGTFFAINADDVYINSGVITSIVSTSGTITFLSGTNLNYSGISTLGILTSNQITSQELEVTGISNLNNIVLDGYLSIGGTTGQQNQTLVSTGVGVTWKPISNLRISTSFTATPGQTSFSTIYSIGYVDVYINGVKLTNTEFTATNGTSIVLNDPCFGSESVEIISFEIDYPLTFSGITLQEEGTVVGTGINAINFVGTAVTAVSVGAGSTIFVNAQLPLTSSSEVEVGIITTTLLDGVDINVSGISTLNNVIVGGATTALMVNGDARVSGILTIGAASITLDGNANIINVGSGVTINTSGVNVSGIITSIGGFVGDLTGNVTGDLTGNINSAGVSTLTTLNSTDGNIVNLNSTDVNVVNLNSTDGNIVNLNSTDVNVSGIITSIGGFVGDLTGNVTGDLTGNINSAGVSTLTTLNSTDGNIVNLNSTDVNVSGIITSIGGFVGIANTTPVTIQLVGNQLTFSAVGIGSTTLTLF